MPDFRNMSNEQLISEEARYRAEAEKYRFLAEQAYHARVGHDAAVILAEARNAKLKSLAYQEKARSMNLRFFQKQGDQFTVGHAFLCGRCLKDVEQHEYGVCPGQREVIV